MINTFESISSITMLGARFIPRVDTLIQMPDINWNAAYGFWLVAKHGSFAEASRASPRGSVQALNKRVRGLEAKENLNLQLLKSRGVKGVQLTAAGQRLYEHLDQAFRDFDKLASDLRKEASGTLKVVATSYVAENYIPNIIASFSPQFSDVSIHLHVCGTPEVMTQVVTGAADVGICSPMAELRTVTSVVGCPMRFELLVPAKFMSKSPFPTWEEVLEWPLVLPEKTSVLRQAFDNLMRERGLETRVHIKAELTTPELSLEATRAGMGVALVALCPRFPKELSGVSRLSPPPGLPQMNLSIVRPKDSYTPKYISAFIRVASRTMANMGEQSEDSVGPCLRQQMPSQKL